MCQRILFWQTGVTKKLHGRRTVWSGSFMLFEWMLGKPGEELVVGPKLIGRAGYHWNHIVPHCFCVCCRDSYVSRLSVPVCWKNFHLCCLQCISLFCFVLSVWVFVFAVLCVQRASSQTDEHVFLNCYFYISVFICFLLVIVVNWFKNLHITLLSRPQHLFYYLRQSPLYRGWNETWLSEYLNPLGSRM